MGTHIYIFLLYHFPHLYILVLKLTTPSHYDHVTINTIINTAPILHVSFNDPEHPFPVVLPMLGRTGDFPAFEKRRDKAVTEGKGEDDEEVWKEDVEGKKDIYIHGWVSGRLFRMGKNAAGEGDGQEEEGLPVTVAAS